MSHTATLQYDEKLVRRAVFAFWRRTVGVTFLLAAIFTAGMAALLFYYGDRPFTSGAMAALTVLAIGMSAAVYVTHYRNSLQKFREMGRPQSVFTADDDTFTLTSDLGTSTFAWATIKEVWQFPDFWLLLFSKAQFATFPTKSMPVEMQDFVLGHIRAVGGKIS